MRFLIAILLSVSVLFAAPAGADQTLTGALIGTFTGATTDNSATFSGNIEGQWLATIATSASGSSSISASGSGTFGAKGLSGTWQITGYDPATGKITVAWSAPGNRGPLSSNGSADGSVALIFDPATGKATGAFTGQYYSGSGGVKTVNGTWTVSLQNPATATVRGSVNGSFAGTASFVNSVSGAATGTWVANVQADGSITGSANGTFNGGNIAVPYYGNVCICGTWTGTLTRSSLGVYSFEGAWTQPVISGSAAGSGGGPMSWTIDINATPFRASGDFSGATSFSFLSFTVPISASGTWNATLPLTP
ncbi:MAG: hypothetical protein KGZ83_11875 [Sulfuricella sp.]|nr:hypothetical protein [Sulfuricella sp.]